MPDFGSFRGFGDKLVQGQTPTQLGLIGSFTNIDPDAQAFFDRVTTNGGTLSVTEQLAVNTLVFDMKTDGIWSAMKAIYPMVGASAAACAQNLKSSSFTGTFSTGWTFASTGVTPNGTSAYMNTGFNTNTNQTVNNFSMSAYLRTTTMGAYTDMGNADASYLPLTFIETNATTRRFFSYDFNLVSVSTTDASGMWGTSRSGTSAWITFQRNTAVAQTSTNTQTTLPNYNVYLGGANVAGALIEPSPRQIAFAHLGDSLTSTQYNNFYTVVQAFQTTLSRQV